jgi:hydroxyethylthiazole kinase
MLMHAEAIWNDVCAIREKSPLIHNITNYVVMNNTANALLAIGASPVMAHAPNEMDDMVALTGAVGGALVINIGTLSDAWIGSMETAMRAAASRNIPIVLDPVGAGATPYRTNTCARLLNVASPTVIRGNASEIMALLDAGVRTKGVDSAASSDTAMDSATRLAQAHTCVVSVSGEVDIITDGKQTVHVANGHAMMTRVTGLGCTASALTGACCAVNENRLQAAAHAMAIFGICGEMAAEKADGPGSLQMHLYDALYTLSEAEIQRRLK